MATMAVTRMTNLDLRGDVLPTVKDMRAIGNLAIQRIWTRTKAGIAADGQPFAAYSPGYEKRRVKHGRPAQPDLQVSGEMLRAMTLVEVTPTRVTIGFSY